MRGQGRLSSFQKWKGAGEGAPTRSLYPTRAAAQPEPSPASADIVITPHNGMRREDTDGHLQWATARHWKRMKGVECWVSAAVSNGSFQTPTWIYGYRAWSQAMSLSNSGQVQAVFLGGPWWSRECPVPMAPARGDSSSRGK